MRFMIIVRATAESEAGVMPEQALLEQMGRFHEELARAGLLLEGSGLQPSSRGWRVRYAGDQVSVVDGPFAETKELIAGYTLIQARSRQEALEWTRRFPNPAGAGKAGEIEVRQLFELEDFEPGDAIERFRALQRDLDPAQARRGAPQGGQGQDIAAT